MEEIKGIIKIASIYITTIIGAGFASGQEIMKFFSSYREGGIYGIVLSGVLFAVVGFIVLDKVYREKITNYDDFIFPSLGKFLGYTMEVIVILFMGSVFSIMIAGSGNIVQDKLHIPFNYSIIIMVALCLVLMLTDIKGIITLSVVVTPVLVIGIIAIGFYIMSCNDITVFNAEGAFHQVTGNWFFSALLYVSYNSIMAIVVMCSLLPYLKTRRVGALGGILGGLMIGFIAFVLNYAITLFYPGIMVEEIPVLNIVEKYSGALSHIYSFVLWVAMFVSAVTGGYFFVDRIRRRTGFPLKTVTVCACILVIPLSRLGFSTLVVNVYPIFGYAGLFMIFFILIQAMAGMPGRFLHHKKAFKQ